MKKLVCCFWVVFSFSYLCQSQTPYFIEDINSCTSVYDTTKLNDIPLLSLFVNTFNGGLDTNFVAIVEPEQKFRKIFDYPYPNDTLVGNFDDMFGLTAADNSKFWTSAKINTAIDLPMQPTGFESISTFDSAINLISTVTMNIPYTYTFHRRVYNTNIVYDTHDYHGFELNGKVYILAIGTHLEWYDAATSWIGVDSMRVRFTTLHILDAATNTEVARWEPQKQGYTLENFGQSYHLQTQLFGMKFYSHPHINVIEPLVNASGGVSIFASARHPGIINKLYWDGISSNLTPQWMFGPLPRNTVPIYLQTVTSNQLDACHGAAAFVKGDTTFIATYNNHSDFNSVGGRHQVWSVYNNTAKLVWQTPDIGVQTICKGSARWSKDGKYLLTTHGNCTGAIPAIDSSGNSYMSTDYEKFQVWDPWTNTKIAGIYLTGSVSVAGMQFIEDEKILAFDPIDVQISDSIKFTHSHPGFVFWTIGNVRYSAAELKLPLTYADSLDEISAWVKTGYTGAWRIDEKQVTTATSIPQNQNLPISLATVQNIDNYVLPEAYNWMAYNVLGAAVSPQKINTPGLYILTGYDKQNVLVYRKKHVFVR